MRCQVLLQLYVGFSTLGVQVVGIDMLSKPLLPTICEANVGWHTNMGVCFISWFVVFYSKPRDGWHPCNHSGIVVQISFFSHKIVSHALGHLLSCMYRFIGAIHKDVEHSTRRWIHTQPYLWICFGHGTSNCMLSLLLFKKFLGTSNCCHLYCLD
jgi:hypothetical protein